VCTGVISTHNVWAKLLFEYIDMGFAALPGHLDGLVLSGYLRGILHQRHPKLSYVGGHTRIYVGYFIKHIQLEVGGHNKHGSLNQQELDSIRCD